MLDCKNALSQYNAVTIQNTIKGNNIFDGMSDGNEIHKVSE